MAREDDGGVKSVRRSMGRLRMSLTRASLGSNNSSDNDSPGDAADVLAWKAMGVLLEDSMDREGAVDILIRTTMDTRFEDSMAEEGAVDELTMKRMQFASRNSSPGRAL
jgi:hypothetical protein